MTTHFGKYLDNSWKKATASVTPTMTLIRCSRCGRVLGDYRMTDGEIRIKCVRSGCKKENVITVNPQIKEGEGDK